MGVYHEHIVLYGYEFPYGTFEDELGWEKCDELRYDEKQEGEMALVSDGMAGEYELFGVLLYRSGSNRSGEATIPLMEIPNHPGGNAIERLVARLVELDMVGEATNSASNYVLTHHR